MTSWFVDDLTSSSRNRLLDALVVVDLRFSASKNGCRTASTRRILWSGSYSSIVEMSSKSWRSSWLSETMYLCWQRHRNIIITSSYRLVFASLQSSLRHNRRVSPWVVCSCPWRNVQPCCARPSPVDRGWSICLSWDKEKLIIFLIADTLIHVQGRTIRSSVPTGRARQLGTT